MKKTPIVLAAAAGFAAGAVATLAVVELALEEWLADPTLPEDEIPEEAKTRPPYDWGPPIPTPWPSRDCPYPNLPGSGAWWLR